jgi:hypothetical protein
MMEKRRLAILIAVTLSSIALILLTIYRLPLLMNADNAQGSFIPPLYEAFMSQAREVSLEEFVRLMRSHGLEILIPTYLPRGMTLTTIYYKCCPLVAMMVYSAKGEKDFRYAELVIEISPSGLPPSEDYLLSLNRTSSDVYVLKTDRGYARIYPEALFGDEERNRKFGPHVLAIYDYGGVNYLISILRPITLKEVEDLIKGLAPP